MINTQFFWATDLDGTLICFGRNADEVVIPPAAVELLCDPEIPKVIVTGRDFAGFQKLWDRSAGSDHRIPCDVIASHGGEFYDASTQKVQPPSLSFQEITFLEDARQKTAQFLQERGWIEALEQKPYSLSINFRSGPNPQALQGLAENLLSSCTPIPQISLGSNGELVPGFEVRQEDGGCELRSIRYNKGIAVQSYLDRRGISYPIIFTCDSLRQHGTDYSAAIAVTDRGGQVWHVINGQEENRFVDDLVRPTAVFNMPIELIQHLTETFLGK